MTVLSTRSFHIQAGVVHCYFSASLQNCDCLSGLSINDLMLSSSDRCCFLLTQALRFHRAMKLINYVDGLMVRFDNRVVLGNYKFGSFKFSIVQSKF